MKIDKKIISNTKNSTFCIGLPDNTQKGMPRPTGTGFFISPDGWFVTAAHVVTEDGSPHGKPRSDLDKAWLTKESYFDDDGKSVSFGMCPGTEGLSYINGELDFALLKVDFEKNNMREGFKDLEGFPYLSVSADSLSEGDFVLSFGYPLSTTKVEDKGGIIVADVSLSPRLTSAMISSGIDRTTMISSPNMPKVYVLDKALNYGNSGGPIVSSETGFVHALCSRFQPYFIPQNHLKGGDGNPLAIMSPSLYGIVSRLNNAPILKEFNDRGIQLTK